MSRERNVDTGLSPRRLCELASAALERRRPLSGLALVRLFDGAGDGRAGVFADKLDSLAILHLLAGSSVPDPELAREAAPALAEIWAVETIYLRVHEKDARRTSDAELLHGPRRQELTIADGPLRLLARPEANVNAGIFIDMREVRSRIREGSAGAKVLNAFCFTGSIGLAALAGGAEETVQLDISRSALRWAKENLEANPGHAGRMRFICEDTRDFMAREIRRSEKGGRQYDLIVLDPPAFGSGSGKPFGVERDLSALVDQSCALLAPRGQLIVCCNHRRMSASRIAETALEGLSRSGRAHASVELLGPPELDFPDRSEGSISMRGAWIEAA